MAGKFNLLTIMTLNAAGYKAGIDDAKKTTQSLVTGTSTAVNSISGHFSKLGGMASGVIAPLNGIKSVVMSGIGSFKAMIPAINGVKMAIVATGIGAIVIALGLAFAALTTYISGTSEGSKKLREMLGYISGAVTALMNRIKYLGGALFSILTGDIEGFKKNIKEAFKSGFLDEVVESAKKSNDIEKQKSANVKIQRDLKTQIADLELESAKYNQKLRDPKLTEGVRLEYLNKLLDVEDKIEQTKLNAANADLKYRKDIVALKGISANGEEKDAVADAMVNVRAIERARIDAGTRTQKIEAKLLNAIASDEKESYKARIDEAKKYEVDKITAIKFTQESLKKKGSKELNKPELIPLEFTKLDLHNDGLDKFATTQQKILEDGLTGWQKLGIVMKSAGTNGTETANVLNGIGETIGNLSGIFGEQTIAYKAFAIAQASINTFLGASQVLSDKTVPTFLKPILMGSIIGLGLANVAKIAGFANGGIVGGNSVSGDKVHVRVNSGEMILNQAQQANLFAMANGSGGSGGSAGGTVEFKISGNSLIGVLNNQSKRTNNMK